MFTFIHGNRQELLARHLAAQIRTQPLNIFEREVVVVQSGGMARWLQMALAEELGIATQLRFTFPAGYLWELFGKVLPDVPRETPFSSDIFTWQLLRLMPELLHEQQGADFEPLRRYLADDDALKRHGLARKLAQCFDSYLAYRPEWVAAWLAGKRVGLGEHEAWQASLWQRIGAEAGELPDVHPAELFFRALEHDDSSCSRLPARLTVFGIGAMPPPYLDIFKRLGRHIDVSFYLLNPCREYWGDLVTDRALARAALETPEALPLLETGHPLLGSLGQVTRASFERLAGENDVELFVEAGEGALLDILQGDILDMRRRPPEERVALAAGDASIQFHVCHGATREIEVLHDRLLKCFAADPSLQPHDVLVLTPDIIAMAPLIEAVFSTQGLASGDAFRPRHAIPYTIADRPLELEAPLLRAFNALLDLARGRLDAESVLAVLEQPCIAARFGFDAEGLELVRAWVGESGIRWGWSAATRAARGLPADAMHSWSFGLRRMLLGIALPEKAGALFEGVLPFDAIEGVRAQVLSRLLGFMDALEVTLQQLARERSVAEWAELLPLICQRFCYDESRLAFADNSAQRAVNTLRVTLQQLAQAATRAACDAALPLDVIRRELSSHLNDMPPGWAFLGGGVTFAQLLAYRGMPARMVCLIGMNDGAFPRNPAVPGFDLLRKHPQIGDREQRAEDRHAFFEALLSARDHLHVSWSGRGIRDNAELPPSMLVAELRDAIDQTACVVMPDGAVLAASDALTVQHRLQAFSPRYFDGSDANLYSHSAHYAHAAVAARGERAAAAPFVTQPLPEAPPELLTITPQQFVNFFRNPAQHLLRARLGIHLEESEGLLETVEPFVPEGLARYWLRTQLVEDWQGTAPTLPAVAAPQGGGTPLGTARRGVRRKEDAYALAHARGLLPHGAAGAVWFDGLWDEFAPFAAQVAASGGVALPPCRIALEFADVEVQGSLGGLQQCGDEVVHLEWRVGDIRPMDRLSLWLRHLLLHAAGQRCSSLLMTPAASWRIAPLHAADVAALFALYKRGSSELLPFFPATSLHWITAQREGKDSYWKRDWEPGQFTQRAESQDAYVALAWNGCEPFSIEFEMLAGQIYGPMLEHTAEAAEADA
ncbi:MAG TPA: exodeoxyribonuclease V subunit gamma [Rhodocyclaceae bacterium]|nr:exodeoxyribonuclease V subunit gamma [Rhodocyclaceae bacterium]